MAKGKREGKVTQKVMVQTALDQKGWDVSPTVLQGFIKEQFGVELAVHIISNYKSVIKREGRKGGGKRGRKAGAQFSDLQEVRALVDRLGADQVKKLVDVAGMFA